MDIVDIALIKHQSPSFIRLAAGRGLRSADVREFYMN
jgi:hypothetical protein